MSAAFDAHRFVRERQQAARGASRTSDRWSSLYVGVVIVLVFGAWTWGGVHAMGAQIAELRAASAPGGPLNSVPAPWVGPGFPVAAAVIMGFVLWVALVRNLCALGPASATPAEVAWLWRLPDGSRKATRGRLLNLAVLAASAAGGLGLLTGLTGVVAGAWPSWAVVVMTAGCALSGCLAVGVAVLRQRRRSAAAPHEPVPGWELRRAGLATRHLRNAVAIGSVVDMGEAVAVRDLGSTPGVVRALVSRTGGPRRAILVAACAAEQWPRLGSRILTTFAMVVALVVGFPDVLTLASWAALAVVGWRGFGTGVAYLRDVRSDVSAERLLPTSDRTNACVRLVLPCLLNAVVLSAVSTFLALAAQQPILFVSLLGFLAGIGLGCAGVHRMMSPPADHSEPLVDTPMGALPVSLLAAAFRGSLPAATVLTSVGMGLRDPSMYPAAAILCLGGTALAVFSAVRSSTRCDAQPSPI